jgi:lipopolysaccharide/colanic/teichoic acid biosynthesis glycosyltransferase
VGINRKYLLLGVDLCWVGLSPFVALLVRDYFAPHGNALTATTLYACLSVIIAAVVFPLAGLNRALWRYTSLAELMRLQAVVTVTVLLAVLITFAYTRLLDIPRSLPLLQWFFLMAAMTGTRLAIRVWRERNSGIGEHVVKGAATEHVLIVGVSQLAEVYLRAMVEFGKQRFSVVGLLANGTYMPGRLLRSYKVLGAPEDLRKVAQELEVHGTWLDRVVVAEDAKQLSPTARQALLEFERSSEVRIDWLPELLGFGRPGQLTTSDGSAPPAAVGQTLLTPGRRHRYPKRLIDVFAAAVLLIITAPLFAVIAPLIAIDVGLPVVFWQHRPGRSGRHFKLYKFRTMRAPHDEDGDRIADQHRVSKFGALIRLSRLDELPQLYNILVGEMSFVGPRPLLVTDHEPGTQDRLLVRPGLTGWAQVNGGRKLSPEDKAALDIWYVAHLSLALDLSIMLRTIRLFLVGEHINQEAVAAAHTLRLSTDAASSVPATVPQPAKIAATVQSAA